MKKSIVLILLLLALFYCLTAEEKKNTEIAGYPAFNYSDETGFICGGIMYLRYRPQNNNINIPRNFIYLSAKYSQKKQFYALLKPKFYLGNGRDKITSSFRYKNWPSTFYGIGNNCNKDDGEDFTPRVFSASLDIKRRIYKNWSVSLAYDFDNYRIIKKTNDGILASTNIPGSEDHFVSGAGISIDLDTRDTGSYPQNGCYCTFKITGYSDIIGSNYSFTRYSLDLRKYISITSRQVLAIQGYFSSIQGNAPFHKMAYLDNHLRATPSNLYMDKHLGVIRAEHRWFPWSSAYLKRFGFVGFVDIGQVADKPRNFAITEFKINYGIGLRYSLFLSDRLNLHIDLGFGENEGSLSIGSGEAF